MFSEIGGECFLIENFYFWPVTEFRTCCFYPGSSSACRQEAVIAPVCGLLGAFDPIRNRSTHTLRGIKGFDVPQQTRAIEVHQIRCWIMPFVGRGTASLDRRSRFTMLDLSI